MSIKILIVEDEDRLRDVLLEAMAFYGYRAEGVSSAEAALERLAQKAFDIVVTDISLPGMSGLELLRHLPQLRPGIVSIGMTGYGTVEKAVEAMKCGATDFLTKPFELDVLSSTISVAAERVSRHAFAPGGQGVAPTGIVAESFKMRKLLDQVSAIAPFNTTVLVTGETGTGKELVARSIHNQSPRKAHPLVALNCAAVPEQLLEDELFGHVKGAFTGAQTARTGRFEQAEGGTLFLDEIGDMSLPLQSKLLRVLQEREFEKLGSARTIKVDVRIIAATSANLERRMEEGHFRPDLFYRLNVVHLRVPTLRERRDDLQQLARQLLARFCTSTGLPVKEVDGEVWNAFENYHWPGNVRQLQNAMERAAALSGASPKIQLHDLPEEVRGGVQTDISAVRAARRTRSEGREDQTKTEEMLSFDAVVSRVERNLLLDSLNKTGGNKVQAAKLLNMKRTTFVEKLKRLQIETESGGDT